MLSLNKQLLYCLPLAACIGFASSSGYSQSSDENTRLEIDRGVSAREYIEKLRFSRIENDVFYIDELNRPIPMNGLPRFRRPEPEPEKPDQPELAPMDEATRWMFIAFFGALAITVAVVAYRFGGGFGGSFRKTLDGKAKTPDRRRKQRENTVDLTPTDMLLDRLRGMENHREALVLLIENLLPAAARQNDIRLGRSETAREIIRRLPAGWTPLPELKRIVMTEELVQFGGRELPERVFEDCLRRAELILNAGGGKAMAA